VTLEFSIIADPYDCIMKSVDLEYVGVSARSRASTSPTSRSRLLSRFLFCLVAALLVSEGEVEANQAKELYDSILGYKSTYNKLSRPVAVPSEQLVVKLGVKLMSINDLNEKVQILTSACWIHQEWIDSSLSWRPEDFGGIQSIKVPAEDVWKPDMVLYNNADGSYEIVILTRVTLHSTGRVVWKAPTIYISSCDIQMEYFPFDEQTCHMKLGSWTYDGLQVDYSHENEDPNSDWVMNAIDLSNYSSSGTWDLMNVTARKNIFYYPCCAEPYPDVTFYITIRRKTLYYAVNLIIPCIGIALLTSLVFYLPTEGGERVGLGINILLALMVFLVLLADNTPPTSLAMPLITRYLVLVMLLCTFALCLTIFTCNLHLRTGDTHALPGWMRIVFIDFFPKFLGIKARNEEEEEEEKEENQPKSILKPGTGAKYPNLLEGILEDVTFIANNYRENGKAGDDESDWQYVAMVMDRIFFILFTAVGLLSTVVLFTNIPTMWDNKRPIG